MLFDDITQLDATAPLEVFASAPGFSVFTVSPDASMVTASAGLKMQADYAYDNAPPADILCVPGGQGVNPLMTDAPTLDYIRRTARNARYVTSVCTGALLLGAAGLLKGRRATTHWASHRFLEAFGAVPVRERVVVDGDLITGGGVTAGVDFAFALLDAVRGRDAAALTMLALEYDPAPPFEGGSVARTKPELVETFNRYAETALAARAEQVARAAAAL